MSINDSTHREAWQQLLAKKQSMFPTAGVARVNFKPVPPRMTDKEKEELGGEQKRPMKNRRAAAEF